MKRAAQLLTALAIAAFIAMVAAPAAYADGIHILGIHIGASGLLIDFSGTWPFIHIHIP